MKITDLGEWLIWMHACGWALTGHHDQLSDMCERRSGPIEEADAYLWDRRAFAIARPAVALLPAFVGALRQRNNAMVRLLDGSA